MSARQVDIAVKFHPVPPGGYPWFDWTVTVGGVRAQGRGRSQQAALRMARRRVRKIERLRAKLDVPSLIGAAIEDEQP